MGLLQVGFMLLCMIMLVHVCGTAVTKLRFAPLALSCSKSIQFGSQHQDNAAAAVSAFVCIIHCGDSDLPPSGDAETAGQIDMIALQAGL
jgi:hypothetical protein